jgi:hypothetical protein
VVVVERILEAAEEAGVFSVVVGAHAEELGEFGENGAFVVLDEGAVAGGAGVAAGSSVAVGVDPVGLFGGGRIGGEGFGEEVGGCGRTGRHWVSLPDVGQRDLWRGDEFVGSGKSMDRQETAGTRAKVNAKYGGLSTTAAKCAAFGRDDDC